jgi:hypothetical protein
MIENFQGGKSMNRKAIDYFQKSAFMYSKGDIEELLDKKMRCAGPLLAVVMNGIDNLGGMCFGFQTDSEKRSIEFMKNHMGFPESVARFMYLAVRCGMVHQGMPKVGLEFGLLPDRPEKGRIYYRSYDQIYLNVLELAYSYLAAVERIAEEPTRFIRDYPRLDGNSKKAFEEAMKSVEEYSGEIRYGSSLAAYDRTYNLNVSIELPPGD